MASAAVYVADFLNNLIRLGSSVVAAAIGGPGQPANRTVTAGATSVTFTVTATGYPPLSYQWQRQAGGVGGFVSLSNDATYSGATSATLTIATATAGMNGDVFQCIVTNPPAAGTITSSTALLTVNSAPGITSATSTTFVVSTAGTFTVTEAVSRHRRLWPVARLSPRAGRSRSMPPPVSSAARRRWARRIRATPLRSRPATVSDRRPRKASPSPWCQSWATGDFFANGESDGGRWGLQRHLWRDRDRQSRHFLLPLVPGGGPSPAR